ncbi:MAG: hypothetical protein ABJ299_17370, partial [Nitratireductor sp.]
PAAPAAAGEPYRPEGLADHLFGQNDRETIDRLAGAYKGARDELAKGKPAVPDAAAYQFVWSETMKGKIPDNDPAIAAFREIAHEHGYTQAQVDAIPKFMDTLMEKGLIDKPFDAGALLGELAPADFKGTPEEKQAKGGERLAAAEAWIKQLDGFDDGMRNELRLLTTSSAGVRALETIMNAGMVKSVSPGGAQPGAITKADLDARIADPRNEAFGDKFDENFAAETRRLFQQMYPD